MTEDSDLPTHLMGGGAAIELPDGIDADRVAGVASLTLLHAVIIALMERGHLTADEVDEAFDAAIGAVREGLTPDDAPRDSVVLRLERLRSEMNLPGVR